MAKYFNLETVENLIERYTENGGAAYIEAIPGCLGYGTTILAANGLNLYNFVIQEVALNEWSTVHTIRKYAVLPAKYARIIEAL